jgi:hypothetical protein
MNFKNLALIALLGAMSFTGIAAAQAPAAKAKDAAATTATAAKDTPTKPVKKTVEAVPAPTAAEIADAKAKGLVWVNLNTKVYHSDGEFFGKTKNGKFMTEADAKKGGFRAAKEPAVAKAKTTPKTDAKK